MWELQSTLNAHKWKMNVWQEYTQQADPVWSIQRQCESLRRQHALVKQIFHCDYVDLVLYSSNQGLRQLFGSGVGGRRSISKTLKLQVGNLRSNPTLHTPSVCCLVEAISTQFIDVLLWSRKMPCSQRQLHQGRYYNSAEWKQMWALSIN